MAMQDTKRAVRVNVEIVYDDGTLDEVKFDKPHISLDYALSPNHDSTWFEKLTLRGELL